MVQKGAGFNGSRSGTDQGPVGWGSIALSKRGVQLREPGCGRNGLICKLYFVLIIISYLSEPEQDIDGVPTRLGQTICNLSVFLIRIPAFAVRGQ
jgi:hypothetical protein